MISALRGIGSRQQHSASRPPDNQALSAENRWHVVAEASLLRLTADADASIVAQLDRGTALTVDASTSIRDNSVSGPSAARVSEEARCSASINCHRHENRHAVCGGCASSRRSEVRASMAMRARHTIPRRLVPRVGVLRRRLRHTRRSKLCERLGQMIAAELAFYRGVSRRRLCPRGSGTGLASHLHAGEACGF